MSSSDSDPQTGSIVFGMLKAPSTPITPPKTIIECKTKLQSELVEISKLDNIPDFLRREAKRYELLKKKGFTDEEIETIFGYIPQHQVDLASVTWGAFEHKSEHNTMIITIVGDNPYKEGAIAKQIDYAKSKGLKVFSPPNDYSEAIEQYKQLKKDFPEWLAGKDNYAYQTLGHPDIEVLAVADFYYGELLEHKTHYDQIKKVPDWELERTIKRWRDLHKYAKAPKEEIEKHARKLDEVLRVGW